MAQSKALEELTERCRALEKAKLGWTVRTTQTGWFVTAPPQLGKVLGEGTTIPFRDHGRAVINATKKLDRMGLSDAEALLRARDARTPTPAPARTRPVEAPVSPARPVPPATFTPPVAIEEAPPVNGKPVAPAARVTASAGEAALRPYRVGTPQETPIPWSQIEGQAKDMHFDVPLPTRRGPYSRIVRVEMADGTNRFRCWHDETKCQDTYSTAHNAHLHLGHAHPSAITLQRRQARADAEAATAAAKKTAPSPKARTTPAPVKAAPAMPTPAVMPRKTAPVAEAVVAATPKTAAPAPPPAPAVNGPAPAAPAVIEAVTAMLRELEDYRSLAENAKAVYEPQLAELRQQITKLEQQLARERTGTQAAILRAQQAEERVAAFEQGFGALAGLAGLMPKAA